MGLGVEVGKNVKVRVPYHGVVNFDIELPTILSRSRNGDATVKSLKLFFDSDNGSIAISQAMCTTHQVDLVLSSRIKRFEKTFLDSLLGLQKASEVRYFTSKQMD